MFKINHILEKKYSYSINNLSRIIKSREMIWSLTTRVRMSSNAFSVRLYPYFFACNGPSLAIELHGKLSARTGKIANKKSIGVIKLARIVHARKVQYQNQHIPNSL